MNDLRKTEDTMTLSLFRLEEEIACTGKPPVLSNALLMGLIYKALRGIQNLSELAFELQNNSFIRPVIGLSL